MELYSNEQSLLEELLALKEMGISYSTNLEDSTTILDACNTKSNSFPTPTCFDNYSRPIYQPLNFSYYGCAPFGNDYLSSSPPDFASDSSNTKINDSQTLPYSQFAPVPVFDDDPGQFEPVPELPVFNVGITINDESERKNKLVKKVKGQPSKNLMAERRRRKRLNDRLAMLRSIVPKISKMDRTSILGDTIDYMKELLQRINGLQQEMELGASELGLLSRFENIKPEEMFIRNSPKFDVERRSKSERRIEMCCAGKPGLLVSTVTSLEALGMDIQQCVISCFNDFAMQASCSEKAGQRASESEDIKEALFRNAGYGGTCI